MATIRVYIQPKFSDATDTLAFYDFSNHVQFDTLTWEQNDQGISSTLNASIYSILPVSTTPWSSYAGATEAIKITNALADPFFHMKVLPRTEIQVRDVSTTPHIILWGGVVSRTEESKDGGSIVGSIEAIDYTELLQESVALEYTAPAESTIKQVITGGSKTLTITTAERTKGIATLTTSTSIALGSPYSRNIQAGDTVVVNLSDATYNGVHTITSITPSGSDYLIKFQQYKQVANSSSAAVTGTAKMTGFFTTDNAPGLDSRITVNSSNIIDLNTDYKFSPKTAGIARNISTVSRSGSTATITTSSTHGYAVDQPVTIALTAGPTGYADLNGTWLIATVPTGGTFTITTTTSGTITSGSATGTATAEGVILPTPIKGGTLSNNLDAVVSKGTGTFYLDAGTLDLSDNLTINLHVKSKKVIDLISNGLFETTTGWNIGSYTWDSVGNTGPYGVGNTLYYTGTDHQDVELEAASRIPVTAGEYYFISWREKATKYNKAHMHVRFYDNAGNVVGNVHGYDVCLNDLQDNVWGRETGIINVPVGATKMSPMLHHESFSSSHTVWYTDIQVVKITGAFGFSDRPISDTIAFAAINGGSYTFKDFENPSSPSESVQPANRIYLYAPYTTEDTLTGAKQITNYRNTYDFVQGVWENGGKRVEASLVSTDATDSTLALETARKFFKERGQALKSFEFEHISGPLNVGDVVPFIWNELGIEEALVVRKQVGYLIGQQVYYRVQLGGDMNYQRNTMYLVEQKLNEITGQSSTSNPIASPYPGTPTAGGIVTPAVPTVAQATGFLSVSWQYPKALLKSDSFGGFIVLRSDDAGTTWKKASTGEPITSAANPTSADTMVPEYGDSGVDVGTNYIYKIAAIDTSTNDSIITDYSTVSGTATPDSAPVDFTNAYTGLGINVPKILYSVGEGVSSFYLTSGSIETYLPDAEYPDGQSVWSESQGKLFRASDGDAGWAWVRAAIDKFDVGPSGEISITADRIYGGVLNAGSMTVYDLQADSIKAGDIAIGSKVGSTGLDNITFYNAGTSVTAAYWDASGLILNDTDTMQANGTAEKRIEIVDGQIRLISGDATTAALDGDGINATSITVGAMPGGANIIPNSSFELSDFATLQSVTKTSTADFAAWLAVTNVSPVNVTATNNQFELTSYSY